MRRGDGLELGELRRALLEARADVDGALNLTGEALQAGGTAADAPQLVRGGVLNVPGGALGVRLGGVLGIAVRSMLLAARRRRGGLLVTRRGHLAGDGALLAGRSSSHSRRRRLGRRWRRRLGCGRGRGGRGRAGVGVGAT